MPDTTRKAMNHLMGRRLGRRAMLMQPPERQRQILSPLGVSPDGIGRYDCYHDYEQDDSSVVISICEVMAEPCIVSHATTGYIEHCLGTANQVVVASGQDGSIGANEPC